MMPSYKRGAYLEVDVDFKVDGVLTDPTTVTFKVVGPAGQPRLTFVYGTDPEVSRLSLGKYRLARTYDLAGTWGVRWEGTGACRAVGETTISIDRSVLPS